jgi:hypothetical protein
MIYPLTYQHSSIYFFVDNVLPRWTEPPSKSPRVQKQMVLEVEWGEVKFYNSIHDTIWKKKL